MQKNQLISHFLIKVDFFSLHALLSIFSLEKMELRFLYPALAA